MVRGGGGGGGGGGGEEELKKGSTSMSNLPQEMLIEIFSRLPVRSLLRFRCISKDYCNLIGDPHFITHHFHHSPNNLATFFIDNSTSTLISHPTTLSSNDTRVYEFTSFRPQFRVIDVVGCCNGIVCLRGCEARLDSLCRWDPTTSLVSLCIWNPATREVKYVPDAPISSPNSYFDIWFSRLGFGFDPIHNDYKVVRIVKLSREEEHSLSVYSLSTGEWRELGKVSIKERRSIFVNGVFVNGAVHWLSTYEDLGSDQFILSFDMVLEKFREIPQHDYGKDDKLVAKNIGELGGYLSVVDAYSKGYLEIWVMKEYGVNQSWTKLFTIHDPIAHLMVKQIQRNEVFFWDFSHSRLILYDPKSGTKRYIKLDGMRIYFMVFLYMENLVSLKDYKGA